MSVFEILNSSDYLFIDKIIDSAYGDNDLLIIVTLGNKSSQKVNIDFNSVNINDVNEISRSEIKYRIYLKNYISYLVINESYDNQSIGVYSGNKIRQYLESPFIEMCKKQTLSYQILDIENIKHYGLMTENHIINILTENEFEFGEFVE